MQKPEPHESPFLTTSDAQQGSDSIISFALTSPAPPAKMVKQLEQEVQSTMTRGLRFFPASLPIYSMPPLQTPLREGEKEVA